MIRFTPIYFNNRNFDCDNVKNKTSNYDIKIEIDKNIKIVINFK